MSIEQHNRIVALERKLEALEARLAVVERAEAFAERDEVVMRRKPGPKPRRDTETQHGV